VSGRRSVVVMVTVSMPMLMAGVALGVLRLIAVIVMVVLVTAVVMIVAAACAVTIRMIVAMPGVPLRATVCAHVSAFFVAGADAARPYRRVVVFALYGGLAALPVFHHS
jgi:hypothetical protein